MKHSHFIGPKAEKEQPAALVLAAGGSARMGSPKALLPLPSGGVLLERHLSALSTCCGPIAVVVGAVIEPVRDLLPPGARLAINPRWAQTGPMESLIEGLRALSDLPDRSVVVVPVDTPPVSPDDLERLCAMSAPAVLGWRGRPGHPVLIGPRERRALLLCPPEGGLRALLSEARVVESGRSEVLLNLNTPEEWSAWLVGTARPQGETV